MDRRQQSARGRGHRKAHPLAGHLRLAAAAPQGNGLHDALQIALVHEARYGHAGKIHGQRLEGHEEVEAIEQGRGRSRAGREHLVLSDDVHHLHAARQLLDAVAAPQGQVDAAVHHQSHAVVPQAPHPLQVLDQHQHQARVIRRVQPRLHERGHLAQHRGQQAHAVHGIVFHGQLVGVLHHQPASAPGQPALHENAQRTNEGGGHRLAEGGLAGGGDVGSHGPGPIVGLVAFHELGAPLPRAAVRHILEQPHLGLVHRDAEVARQARPEAREEPGQLAGKGPVGDDVAHSDARHHDAQVDAELPAGVAGEGEAEIVLDLLDAAIEEPLVAAGGRVQEQRLDAAAHGLGREGEQHRHEKAPLSPLGPDELDAPAGAHRQPPAHEHPLPPVQIALHLLLVREDRPREGFHGMGPRRAGEHHQLPAEALEARMHGGLALVEQTREAIRLMGGQHEAQPRPSPP